MVIPFGYPSGGRFMQWFLDSDTVVLMPGRVKDDAESSTAQPGATEGQKTLSELLSHGEDRLKSAWGEANVFDHRGTKGQAREHPIKSFLEGQLPGRFGYLSGEGIDVWGNRTGQLDLVVYDQMRVGPFFSSGEAALIPAEAILATIEVKSVLNLEAMNQFAGNVTKLHRLQPHKKPFAFARSGGAHDDGQPRVQSTLLAYESDLGADGWAGKELERARRCIRGEGCPIRGVDRVVVIDRGMVLPAEGEAFLNANQSGVLRIWFFHFANFLTREAERRKAFPWSQYADPNDEESRVELAKPLAPGRSDQPHGKSQTKASPKRRPRGKAKGRPRQRKRKPPKP